MRLLSVCICVGILICLVSSSYAKKGKKDENSVDVTQELADQDGEEDDGEEHVQVKVKKSKNPNKKSPSKKKTDNSEEADDDDDGEENYLIACEGKTPICKCEGDTLDCEKVVIGGKSLDRVDVVLNDHPSNFKYVIFKNNAIESLDGSLLPEMDTDIETMDFSNNRISKIAPHTFDSFIDLKVLNLNHNMLVSISGSYFTPRVGRTLHKLLLSDNMIKRVHPSAFENLKELTELVLDGNADIPVSKKIFPVELKKLEILSMDRCNIAELDDKIFENLINLKKLSLRNNPIIKLPKAINALPNLFGLDLSGTSVPELTDNQLSKDHNLTELYMSNMPFLYAIRNCSFCDLPNLKKIVLSNNSQLFDINENAFGAITAKKDAKYPVAALEEFDIHDSNFSTLPQKLFNWENIKTLKLHGNPFNCTCEIAWLVNDKKIHIFETSPKCAEPKSLKDVMFTKLDDEVCDGNTSPNSSSFVMWAFVLFLTVIGLIGGFLVYTRRVRVTNILYRPEVPEMGYSNLTAQQQRHPERDDEEELQDDFQPRPDAHPV